jgi:hypothetical protein
MTNLHSYWGEGLIFHKIVQRGWWEQLPNLSKMCLKLHWLTQRFFGTKVWETLQLHYEWHYSYTMSDITVTLSDITVTLWVTLQLHFQTFTTYGVWQNLWGLGTSKYFTPKMLWMSLCCTNNLPRNIKWFEPPYRLKIPPLPPFVFVVRFL